MELDDLFDAAAEQDPFDFDLGAMEIFPIEVLTAPGRESLRRAMVDATTALIPNRPMDIVLWAEGDDSDEQGGAIRLPSKMTKQSGKLRFIGYQKGIVRAPQEDGAEIISLMTVPRIGKTTIFGVVQSYFSAHEGDDTAFWERNEKSAQVYHDTFLYPLMISSPGYRGLLRDRDKEVVKDKWMDRALSNGANVRIRSASTDGSQRQIRARIMFADEVDDPAYEADRDGSKIENMLRRGQNYVIGCALVASSPSDIDTSVIWAEYSRSDRRVYDVPCPHCSTMQPLEPKVGDKEGAGLKYTVSEKGRILDAWYQCANEACPVGRIEEKHKRWMFDNGEWRATAVPERPGLIGFHLWAIHSVDPKSAWKKIAEAHREQIHNPSKRQNFKNNWLGLPWERVDVGVLSLHAMEARAEKYPAEVPDGVRAITFGGDAQEGGGIGKDSYKPARHELVFWGWGYGGECWPISYDVIDGEPFSLDVQEELKRLFTRGFRRTDGTYLRPAGGFHDVNYNMLAGLEFFRKLDPRINAWPCTGKNERLGTKADLWKPGRLAQHQKSKLTYEQLATQSGKEQLVNQLRLSGSGPGVIHMPASLVGTGFAKSLTAIRREKNLKTGKAYFVDKDANEVLDDWVYGYAAHLKCMELFPDYKAAMIRRPTPDEIESYAPAGLVDYSVQSDTSQHDRLQSPASADAAVRRIVKPAAAAGSRPFGARARRIRSSVV